MNFSLIKKHLNDNPICIVPMGDQDFRDSLIKYVQSKNFYIMEYKGRFYIAKECKRG